MRYRWGYGEVLAWFSVRSKVQKNLHTVQLKPLSSHHLLLHLDQLSLKKMPKLHQKLTISWFRPYKSCSCQRKMHEHLTYHQAKRQPRALNPRLLGKKNEIPTVASSILLQDCNEVAIFNWSTEPTCLWHQQQLIEQLRHDKASLSVALYCLASTSSQCLHHSKSVSKHERRRRMTQAAAVSTTSINSCHTKLHTCPLQ